MIGDCAISIKVNFIIPKGQESKKTYVYNKNEMKKNVMYKKNNKSIT